MRPEVRRLSFALAGVVALAAPAWSEGPVTPAAAPAGAGRYALNAARDGFVRLDTATGAVSHCSQEAGVWHCDTIAGEDATLKARLDALTGEVAKLSAAVAALGARVADLAVGNAPTAPVAEKPVVERRAGFAGRAVDRFLAMVRALKHGAPPASSG
jgi:hypothetical protein